MKFKNKPPEKTAMEKRNTSILNFALVALIPLLLTLFLGFSLSKADRVNEENYYQKLKDLRTKHEGLIKGMEKVDTTFSRIDVLLKKFLKDDEALLEEGFNSIEDDIAFNKWNNKRTITKDNFHSAIKSIQAPSDIQNDQNLMDVLDFGKKWLVELSRIKSDELFSSVLIRKQQEGNQINSELLQQIQDLRNEMTEKNAKIIQLEGIVLTSQGSTGDMQVEKTDIQEKYEKMIADNASIKTVIEENAKAIKEKILLDLKCKIFNRENCDTQKKLIETKIDNIRIETGKLKVED